MSLSRVSAFLLVVSGCLAGWLAAAGNAAATGAVQGQEIDPEAMYASAWGEPSHPDLAAFEGWTRKAVAARGVFTPALTAEGVRLAEVRRVVLHKLMRTDPAHALAAAVPDDVRAVLPTAVLARLETPFSATGDYAVTRGQSTVKREVVLPDGHRNKARVYGRRLALNTQQGVSLSGFTLDGESVLEDVAANGTVASAKGVETKSVIINGLGPAPVVNSPSTAAGFATQGFTYRISATNHPTQFAAANLPAGLNIDNQSGLITGAPKAPGIYFVTIAAGNSQGSGQSVVRITVYSNDQAPVILSATKERAFVGQPFSYQIIGINSPTSYDAPGLPAGLSVDRVSGLISGTPVVPTTALMTLSATNARGVGRVTLLLYVDAAPPPSANDNFADARPLPDVAGSVSDNNTAATKEAGEPVHAENAGGRSLWYTWTAPVDGPVSFDTLGSTFDTLLGVYVGDTVDTLAEIGGNDDFSYYGQTGRVDFQAQAGVTYRIAVDGFDGQSGLVSLQYGEVTSAAPQITSAPKTNAVAGASFGYQITATNNPYTYTAVGLPSGIGIDPTSGYIQGITVDQGTYNVTIGATNLYGEGTAVLTLTVGPSGPPVINSVLKAKGMVGVSFKYQTTATNTPKSYSASGLPPGISIKAATGLLSGKPTKAGVFKVALRASNSRGTTTKTLVLTIVAVPTPAFVLPGAAGSDNAQLLEGGPTPRK